MIHNIDNIALQIGFFSLHWYGVMYCLVLELFIGLQEKIYFAQPLEIIKVWKVGMSFHGGLIG